MLSLFSPVGNSPVWRWLPEEKAEMTETRETERGTVGKMDLDTHPGVDPALHQNRYVSQLHSA